MGAYALHGCARACRPHLRPYGAVSHEHVDAQVGKTSMPMPVLSNSGVCVEVAEAGHLVLAPAPEWGACSVAAVREPAMMVGS
jgi:hypothetical protein